jgi:hypothetical protein
MKIYLSKTNAMSTVIKALILTGSIFLLVASYALMNTRKAVANSNDIANARSKYPNIVGTRIDSCSLCHTGSIPNLNPYGSAYLANGRNIAAFGSIESVDSDGDGYTNIQEITALTFPGDPSDHPVPTNTPAPTRTPAPTNTPVPTNPPTATPMPPTATNTPVPTTVGNPPPSPTPTSVISVTPFPTATPTIGPSPSPTIGPSPTPTATCNGNNCNKHRRHRRRHHRIRRHRRHH